MNWPLLTVIAALTMLAYQLVIDWIPLFPWNDVSKKTPRERVLETAINYSPLLLIAYGFANPRGIGWTIATIGCAVYMVGHLNAWWRPYLFGATEKEHAEYSRLFANTYRILPPIRTNPVPDAEHMVIGVLTLVMLICSCMAYFS